MSHQRIVLCAIATFALGGATARSLAAQAGYTATAEIPVVRAGYEPVFSGLHSAIHAGEKVLVTTSGSICVGHVHRTERRGGFLGMFKKKVTIDHHNKFDAGQRPPSFRLAVLDEEDQPPAQTGTSLTFVVPTGAVAGARTTARLEGFIPDVGPRHHLGYTTTIAIDSKGRLDVLRSALAQRAWTKSDVERNDFFSERMRQQFPEILAEMLVDHAAAKWPNDAAERKRLLEFAQTLAPASTKVLLGLGNEYLTQGDYPAAQAALIAVLRAQRQLNPKNHKAWGDAAYGLAETYFQQNMALMPGDVEETRQLLGEAVQAYAAASIPLRADERKALIRLAEVAGRVRTTEALRQAAQAYARAREIVP